MVGSGVRSLISLGDLYPSAGQQAGSGTSQEKANPTHDAAEASQRSQVINQIAGQTGIPPVVLTILACIGLLGLAKIISEKWD